MFLGLFKIRKLVFIRLKNFNGAVATVTEKTGSVANSGLRLKRKIPAMQQVVKKKPRISAPDHGRGRGLSQS